MLPFHVFQFILHNVNLVGLEKLLVMPCYLSNHALFCLVEVDTRALSDGGVFVEAASVVCFVLVWPICNGIRVHFKVFASFCFH